MDDPEEEMPYRISYIDTSVIDRRATDGWKASNRRVPDRAGNTREGSELLEDVSY